MSAGVCDRTKQNTKTKHQSPLLYVLKLRLLLKILAMYNAIAMLALLENWKIVWLVPSAKKKQHNHSLFFYIKLFTHKIYV